MSDKSLELVTKRMRKLQLQSLTLALFSFLAVTLTCSLLGAGIVSRQKVLEAEKFVLRDAHGRQRGRFCMLGDCPGFELMDTKGNRRVSITVTPDGAVINLFGDRGSQKVGLAVTPKGSFMTLHDATGKGGSKLSVINNEGEFLEFLDPRGAVRMSLEFSAIGSRISLYDDWLGERASLFTSPAETAIVLSDDLGTDRATLKMELGGHATLTFRNAKGGILQELPDKNSK